MDQRIPPSTNGPFSPLGRRHFLAAGGTALAAGLAACAPAAAPSPNASASPLPAPRPATPDWERQWNDLVAAAKQEGKLVLLTRPGTSYREALNEFERAFPGITVEQTGMIAIQFVPRLEQERKAGIYSLDAMVSTFGPPARNLKAAGSFDPLRPVLFRPDVLADNAWQGGFNEGWVDNAKQIAYGLTLIRTRWLWINTNLVQEGEIKSVQDLLNPKWKGRIVAMDPRRGGAGLTVSTVARLAYGDDVVRRLWKDQAPVLNSEYRQTMEALVRDRAAVGIGAVNEALLPEFAQAGLGQNIKPIEIDNFDYLSIGLEVAYLVNRAPHPNAAKLFLNWLFTKEGQALWSKASVTNSRRLDVPPQNPGYFPTPGKTYISVDKEERVPDQDRTQDIIKQVLDA